MSQWIIFRTAPRRKRGAGHELSRTASADDRCGARRLHAGCTRATFVPGHRDRSRTLSRVPLPPPLLPPCWRNRGPRQQVGGAARVALAQTGPGWCPPWARTARPTGSPRPPCRIPTAVVAFLLSCIRRRLGGRADRRQPAPWRRGPTRRPGVPPHGGFAGAGGRFAVRYID